MGYIHIFRRTFGGLVLEGRSDCEAGSLEMYLEYMGAIVPPVGPFILLLSVMLCERINYSLIRK